MPSETGNNYGSNTQGDGCFAVGWEDKSLRQQSLVRDTDTQGTGHAESIAGCPHFIGRAAVSYHTRLPLEEVRRLRMIIVERDPYGGSLAEMCFASSNVEPSVILLKQTLSTWGDESIKTPGQRLRGRAKMKHILVIGSINMDLTIHTPRLPRLGETITGSDFATTPGGKGANQAVAAARLGGRVRMIGGVGMDVYAARLEENLRRAGVVTDGLSFSIPPAESRSSRFAAVTIISSWTGGPTNISPPLSSIKTCICWSGPI